MSPGLCPVCSVRFRGASTCSRCGADLSPVMRLVAAAWVLRNRAREALLRGDGDHAAELAAEAEKRCATREGRALALVIEAARRSRDQDRAGPGASRVRP